MQNILKVSAAETGWNHELNLMRCNVHWLGKKKTFWSRASRTRLLEPAAFKKPNIGFPLQNLGSAEGSHSDRHQIGINADLRF